MDELTEQEKHLLDQGYLSNQKIAKLAKLYKKSNLFPISMTTNLFGKDRSNNIKDLIIDYERKNPVGMESNVKAWTSVYKTHLLTDIFSNYLNLILQHSQNLYNKSFSTKEVLEVEEFWVAHYRKGNFTVNHDHGNLLDEFLISGCYYAYVDDNASPIIFDGQKSVYPKSDSLILFSPYTKHEVPPTDGERIVMSFNIIGTSPYS